MNSDNSRPLSIAPSGVASGRPTMYDERYVIPMRRELTDLGFQELRTAEAVNASLPNAKGTSLVVVNSICGCAARNARPAVRLALSHRVRPDNLFTVFAGQDPDATSRARDYFTGYPPSSPSVALLRHGALVWMLERWQIEGRPAHDIAIDIIDAFDRHCEVEASA